MMNATQLANGSWGKLTIAGLVALVTVAATLGAVRARDVATIHDNQRRIVTLEKASQRTAEDLNDIRVLLERVAASLGVETRQ